MGIDLISVMQRAGKRIAELEAERDRLLAESAALREAAAYIVDQIERNDFTDSHGHAAKMLKAFHDCKAALTTPATAEALERVRREANIDLLNGLIDECDTVLDGDLPHITRGVLEYKAAVLRGGQ